MNNSDFLFFLSCENFNFSLMEAESICCKKPNFTYDKLVEFADINIDKINYRDIAFTKKINRVIFASSKNNFESDLKQYSNTNLEKFYDDNFCVRIHKYGNFDKTVFDLTEKKIAGFLYNKLTSPKVSLRNSVTLFEVIVVCDKVYFTKVFWNNREDFNSRKAQNRPEHHPTTLHPRLARGCVNLLGATKKDVILDPFCGSGGILIEAGLMGYPILGFDIDKIMINRSRINFNYFGIDNYELKETDATKFEDTYDYIICDPPYGKNTKQKSVVDIYEKFISHVRCRLGKKMVIIYNDVIPLKSMIDFQIFNILFEENFFIHNNMTRKVILLEKI